jgi:hypothetical protein
MRRLGAAAIIIIVLAIPASADEFGAVVKRIESHYGIQRTHPRLIGFVLFFAKSAMWGSGISGLKVAAFEGENRTFTPSLQELDQIMVGSLGLKWQPFVRVDSRKDGEATVIYADFSDSVVQMKLSTKAIRRWMADPESEVAAHKH